MMPEPTYEQLVQRVKVLEKENQQHKTGDEKLKEQNGFLNLVLESLSHPFYVINADDYTLQLANSAAQAEGISGQGTCHALSHKRQTPCASREHLCPLEIIKQTKKPVTVEHIHYDSHGNPKHVEVHAHPILDDEGNVCRIIEYTLDITKRKQIEEERNQLIKNLQDSLAKIKTLSGLLPICASCKKIRDDKGYWNQIETYLRNHSKAEFSHGICPECAKKLYPDYV
jgi:PAS domain S-box-containing protein